MMSTEPVIVERIVKAPIEKVWSAISDTKEMKQWYFDLAEFKTTVGFEFRFSGGPPEKQYLHICTITEVIPGKRLTYNWRYDGYPGISYVTFDLAAEGGTTRVTLRHAGLESFPNENPHFAKENFVAGWTDIIGRSLKEYVEKK